MLTANISRLHSGLVLLQYPDDLLIGVPALLHAPSSRLNYFRVQKGQRGKAEGGI
jgi:hypothetical protein